MADDELLAVHYDPAGPLRDAERLPEDLRVDDFNSLLATLRDCARPVALIFRRPPHVRASQSAASEANEAPLLSPGGSGQGDDDWEAMEFFCLDNEITAAHLDAIGYAELKAKWKRGDVGPDTKVFCNDTWQNISALPALVASLDDRPRGSFFEDLRVSP